MVAEQLPSVLTTFPGVVDEEELGGVAEVEEVGLVGTVPPDPARYQLAFGSSRHSPTVTDLKPLAYMEART